MDEYIICPKCKRGRAEYIGNGWYQCLWRDCHRQCECYPTRFRKEDAGKIDPNKYKKFRDSIKIKRSIMD